MSWLKLELGNFFLALFFFLNPVFKCSVGLKLCLLIFKEMHRFIISWQLNLKSFLAFVRFMLFRFVKCGQVPTSSSNCK